MYSEADIVTETKRRPPFKRVRCSEGEIGCTSRRRPYTSVRRFSPLVGVRYERFRRDVDLKKKILKTSPECRSTTRAADSCATASGSR